MGEFRAGVVLHGADALPTTVRRTSFTRRPLTERHRGPFARPVGPAALSRTCAMTPSRHPASPPPHLTASLRAARVDVSDNALALVVARVRRAIGDDGNQQHSIRTLPRVGFRWCRDTEQGTLQDASGHADAGVDSGATALSNSARNAIMISRHRFRTNRQAFRPYRGRTKSATIKNEAVAGQR